MSRWKYVTVEAEVDLAEFDTDDLIEELESRGHDYNTKFVDGDDMRMVLQKIFEKRRLGQKYDEDLDTLIYGVLGRFI